MTHFDYSVKTKTSPFVFPLYMDRRLNNLFCFILGFRRQVDENYVLMGYYAACSGDSLPTFPDNLSVPSSRVRIL
jgi:hypothetical protein